MRFLFHEKADSYQIRSHGYFILHMKTSAGARVTISYTFPRIDSLCVNVGFQCSCLGGLFACLFICKFLTVWLWNRQCQWSLLWNANVWWSSECYPSMSGRWRGIRLMNPTWRVGFSSITPLKALRELSRVTSSSFFDHTMIFPLMSSLRLDAESSCSRAITSIQAT